jgi:hypothetical protein
VLNLELFVLITWSLGCEEAAGGGGEEEGREEEELLTGNFGDNRSELSRKWTKQKF